MKSLLFEDPLLLAAVLAGAVLVLAGIWTRSRSRAATRALLAGVAIAPALLFLQHQVKTDREKLHQRLQDMADAVARGQVADIVRFVSPQARFDEGRYTRADFEERISDLLVQCSIENPKISLNEVVMENGRAEATCRSTCTVSTSRWTQPVRSRWRITLERQAGTWMITALEPLEIQGQRHASLWDIHVP